MSKQQRNRSSSPQKKIKGPIPVVIDKDKGQATFKKKEQAQILQSVKEMFESQIDPDVIQMVLIEKTWKVEEAVEFLSSMVEPNVEHKKSHSCSQFDLIAVSLLETGNSSEEVKKQQDILDKIKTSTQDNQQTAINTSSVILKSKQSDGAGSLNDFTHDIEASKIKGNNSSFYNKETPKIKSNISSHSLQNTIEMAAIKKVAGSSSVSKSLLQGRNSSALSYLSTTKCMHSNSHGDNYTGLDVNSKSSTVPKENIAGLSYFTMEHHDTKSHCTLPLQSYMDMYEGSFGLSNENKNCFKSESLHTQSNDKTTISESGTKHKMITGQGHVRTRSFDTKLYACTNKSTKTSYSKAFIKQKPETKSSDVSFDEASYTTQPKDIKSVTVGEKKRIKSKSIASMIQDSGIKMANSPQFNNSISNVQKMISTSTTLSAGAPVFQPQQSNVMSPDLFTGQPVFMTPQGPKFSTLKPSARSVPSKSPNWINYRPRHPHYKPRHDNFAVERFMHTTPQVFDNKNSGFTLVKPKHGINKMLTARELLKKYIKDKVLVLVLLRGLPGSGKSHLAREIVNDGIILSTDDYFYKDSVYNFDPDEISVAHTWNKQRAINAMEAKISPVVIDNTNTKIWEMKPYAKSAVINDYVIVIMEPDTPWKFKPRELQARNVHGVGKDMIIKMKDRFDKNVTVDQLLQTDPRPVQTCMKTSTSQPQIKLEKVNSVVEKYIDENIALNINNDIVKESSDSGINMEEGVNAILAKSIKGDINKDATDSGINMQEEVQDILSKTNNENVGNTDIFINHDLESEIVDDNLRLNTENSEAFYSCKPKQPSPKPMRIKKENRHNSNIKNKEINSFEELNVNNFEIGGNFIDNEVKIEEVAARYKPVAKNDVGTKQCSSPVKKTELNTETENNPELTVEKTGYESSSKVYLDELTPQGFKHSSTMGSNCSESAPCYSSITKEDLHESSAISCSEEFFDANCSVDKNPKDIVLDEINEGDTCENVLNTPMEFSNIDSASMDTESVVEMNNEDKLHVSVIEVERSGTSENNYDTVLKHNSPKHKQRKMKRSHRPLIDKELKLKFKTETWNTFGVEEYCDGATLPIIQDQITRTIQSCEVSTYTEGKDFKFLHGLNSGNKDDSYDKYEKILSSKGRDINQHTSISTVSGTIERIVRLDKGSNTDDLSSSFEPNLDFLRNSFPDVSEGHLKEILNMCQNDVEWAINLILDCDSSVYLTTDDKQEIASEVLKLKRENLFTGAVVDLNLKTGDDRTENIDLKSPKSLFDICNTKIQSCHLDSKEIQQNLIQNGMKQLEQIESHGLKRMKSVSHDAVKEGSSMPDVGENCTNQNNGSKLNIWNPNYYNSLSYMLYEDMINREGVINNTSALQLLEGYDNISDESSDDCDKDQSSDLNVTIPSSDILTPVLIPSSNSSELFNSESRDNLNNSAPFQTSNSLIIRKHAALKNGAEVPISCLDCALTSSIPSVVCHTSRVITNSSDNATMLSSTVNTSETYSSSSDLPSLSFLAQTFISSDKLDNDSTPNTLQSDILKANHVTPVDYFTHKSSSVSSVGREITSQTDVTQAKLSLKLPLTLVNQLQQLFDPIEHCSVGEDVEIYLDLKTAEQLHRCIENNTQLKNDEALARQIQEQDNRQKVTKRNRKEPKPVYLEDIIQEELDRKHTKEKQIKYLEATGNHIAIATKLKRQKLLEKFPGVDESFFEEIFQANGYSYEDTEYAIKSVRGPDIPVKTVMTAEAEEDFYQKLIEEAKQKSLLDMLDRPSSKQMKRNEYQNMGLNDVDYRELRGEADLHHRLRQQCFVKAREAFQRGMKEVSSFYAQQGHLHTKKVREANMRASQKILEFRQAEVKEDMTLDLHGFHVGEAVSVLNNVIEQKEKEFSARPDRRRQYLFVITGRGLNSRGGVAKIKPAILNHLKSNNIRFNEEKPGLLKVQLRYKQGLK